ncbi:unnamed protein product [Symbiodinium sp. KB8]|nr:unnamed protein product [Symbiodinium sp. KB8]
MSCLSPAKSVAWAMKKAGAHERPGSAIGALLLEEEAVQPEGPEADEGWAAKVDKRQTVTAAVKLKAIEAHLATKEMGHPVVDDFNRACGTPFSYNSVYGWKKKRAELEKMAAKETRSKLSKQKKGWFRNNELVKKFNHRYQKTLRKTRRNARNLTTKVALAIAFRVYDRLERKHPNMQFPVVRKTGQRWKPSGRWVRGWFLARGWKPRKATKKRGTTPAADSAAMQRFLDKLRFMLQQRPDVTDEVAASEGVAYDSGWGHFERGGCVAVTTGPPKWSKRYCTWDMAYSADLTGPQPPAVLYFPGKGRVSQLEKLSYHPDTKVVWTPKGYLNGEANKAWCEIWNSWKAENLEGPVLLTLDNVSCQKKRSFQRCLLKNGTVTLHGEPNATHVWQMIDRHVGRMHKKMLTDLQLEYLSDRDHFRGFSKLSAMDRRILLSHWVGEVRQMYIEQKVQQHLACASASGLRIRLDRIDDEKVTVEANPLFRVQDYVHWNGLEEAIEKEWVEDEEEVAEVSPSPVSSASSSSSSSSGSAATSDAEASSVAASSESEVEAVVDADEDLADNAGNYVTVPDLKAMLQKAHSAGKINAGMRMLVSFSKNKTPISHPQRLAGKLVLYASLKKAADSLELEGWRYMPVAVAFVDKDEIAKKQVAHNDFVAFDFIAVLQFLGNACRMSITVEVGLLSGKTATVQVGFEEKVEALKLRAQTALAVGRGRLVDSSGSVLDAFAQINSTGLQDGDSLILHLNRAHQSSSLAFASILGDASVMTWGSDSAGADSAAVQDRLRDVQQVQACNLGFAAILGDGSVVSQLKNVQQIQANVGIPGVHSGGAFAAILGDGSVVAWGDGDIGGDCSAVQDQLQSVRQIQASEFGAFAAILSDGSVVTWGEAGNGGNSNGVQHQLKNVQQIQATLSAFAAILGDGSVVTWGDAGRGGDSSAVQDQLRTVQKIQATDDAFAAILEDGSVVTWGAAKSGGDSFLVQDQLRCVEQIQASESAFAAICSDGVVVTWGSAESGGDSSGVQDQLKNVQQIQASKWAFAAVLDDGSVVTLGDADSGGDSGAVQGLLKNVQQIQASESAFAAILGDGSVVTWGDAYSGGDSNAAQDQLKNVQQIQASKWAFAAILDDGSVVPWGYDGSWLESLVFFWLALRTLAFWVSMRTAIRRLKV